MGLLSLLRRKEHATAPAPVEPQRAPARPTFTTDLSKLKLTGDWVLDPAHSSMGFAARHAMVTRVRGIFTDFEGHLHLDGEHPEFCWAQVRIQVGSIDTRVDQRDEHLRSPDFFDVERYPEITFRSISAEQTSEDSYQMTGELAIKNQVRMVTMDLVYTGSVVDAFGVERVGFDGTTHINRTEWGLTWNAALETGGVLVSEKIKLELDISAIRVS
ncbi:YceI family protein [Streptomyces sp. NPDC005438]|uniref:YceI family protein n=1 Tax=Streptomyces sp. NPDC005438 TaxID=3156880 RepID=UPI0033AAE731